MMQSSASFFKNFIDWLDAQGALPKTASISALNEFGGVNGVVEDDLYISAYEELGRCLAKTKDLCLLCDFISSNKSYLSQNPGQLYYFMESLVDEFFAKGSDISALVEASPESYKEYLYGRFGVR